MLTVFQLRNSRDLNGKVKEVSQGRDLKVREPWENWNVLFRRKI